MTFAAFIVQALVFTVNAVLGFMLAVAGFDGG
jgi:hypothetical protein